MSKRQRRSPRKIPLQSEAEEDAASLASLLSLAPGENECNRITWLWDVYKAFQQNAKFRRLYNFARFFSEHTFQKGIPVRAEYITQIKLLAKRVAKIALEHGVKIKLGWLFDLLQRSAILWIDSWNRAESAETLLVLLKSLEDLERIVLMRYNTRGTLPAIAGINDGQPTLATTIGHLYCFQSMLQQCGATAAFLNLCGVSDTAVSRRSEDGLVAPGDEK